MPATGKLTILGSVVGLVSGNKVIAPPAITSTNAAGETLSQALNSGDNTIAVPPTATAVVITPPAGNTIVLKLKGSAGDTGLTVSKVNPSVIPFDSPPMGSFIINAAGGIAGLVEFNFV